MPKIVVLGGAGGMGSEAVKDLSLNNAFSEIIVADADQKGLDRLVTELNNENVSTTKIDVNDFDRLVQLLKQANVVLSFIGPYYEFGPKIIRAAIEAKVHYVDICDDYDAAEAIIKMDKDVKKAGITVLTGMGTSPGITNILARMGMDELDKAEEIDTLWVMGGIETGTAILYHVFHGGSGTVPGFNDGQRKHIHPFTEEGALEVEFPNPLNKVKLYDIGHPEPITIPHFFPEIKKVTNKGAILPKEITNTIINLLNLGFDSTVPIHFDENVTLSARDFIVRYLQHNPDLLSSEESLGYGGLKVIVKGVKNGESVAYVYTTMSNETTGESTGVPAAIGAELLAKGEIPLKGVIAPELIEPAVFFGAMSKRKRVNNNVKGTGLMIEKILEDGSIEVIRGNRLEK